MVLKSALIVNHGADRGAGVSSGRQAGGAGVANLSTEQIKF